MTHTKTIPNQGKCHYAHIQRQKENEIKTTTEAHPPTHPRWDARPPSRADLRAQRGRLRAAQRRAHAWGTRLRDLVGSLGAHTGPQVPLIVVLFNRWVQGGCGRATTTRGSTRPGDSSTPPPPQGPVPWGVSPSASATSLASCPLPASPIPHRSGSPAPLTDATIGATR